MPIHVPQKKYRGPSSKPFWPFAFSHFLVVDTKKSNSANSEISMKFYCLLHSTWQKGMSNTTVNTWDTCTTVTIFYQVTYRYIFGENDTCTTSVPIFRVINLVSDIDNQLNALWWKCRDSRLSIQARFVAKKQETKCYLNWALYYRGNILPKHCRSRTNTILRFT